MFRPAAPRQVAPRYPSPGIAFPHSVEKASPSARSSNVSVSAFQFASLFPPFPSLSGSREEAHRFREKLRILRPVSYWTPTITTLLSSPLSSLLSPLSASIEHSVDVAIACFQLSRCSCWLCHLLRLEQTAKKIMSPRLEGLSVRPSASPVRHLSSRRYRDSFPNRSCRG